MVNRVKITVVGCGYVGMSLAVLLAQHNDVTILDIDASRVNKVNAKQSTVLDNEIESFLVKKELTSDAAGGEKAGGGKRKTKRRSTQKKCKNTHKKKSIRKNTKNKQQVRKTCKIQRYRKHKYTNKRRQRKQNKKK